MRRYRLTPDDRERQGTMSVDSHLPDPVPLPLVLGDPVPVALRSSSSGGWTAFLHVAGVPVWHCTHRHCTEAGALTCAWRQRGVEMQRSAGGAP
jgi:hypothetical protein